MADDLTTTTTTLTPAASSSSLLDAYLTPGVSKSSSEDQEKVPMGLRLLQGIETALRCAFTIANVVLVPLLILRQISWSSRLPPSLLGYPWACTLAIISFEIFLYLMAFIFSSFDRPHAANMFGHLYCAFGPQNYKEPNRSGLTHARQVDVPTSDGLVLGAWHVLPGGEIARAAARKIAAGAEASAVFDAMLHGAAGLYGVRAVVYLHGMGESRCKWVVTEHLAWISSLLGVHVLAIDYRARRPLAPAPLALAPLAPRLARLAPLALCAP